MKTNPLSIAIVTHRRPKKLSRCLDSLTLQTIKPHQVIIIDNDTDQGAKTICEKYADKLSIVYSIEPTHSTPHARNQALAKCTTPLCGFVDDDCVLDKNWVSSGLKAMRNTGAAYIVGHSLVLNDENLIAQAQFQTYIHWFYTSLTETRQIDPKNLDTKNVILRIPLIKKHNLKFDTRFYINSISVGEDVDLGLQLNEHGLKGIYEPSMILYHEEIASFYGFIKKAFIRGKVSFMLYDKWRCKGQLLDWVPKKPYDWLFNIHHWPYEAKQVQFGTHWEKIRILLLVKLYDRSHLIGFLKQQKITNK